MIKYIKDSIRELKHVVWPTRDETKNYFISVVAILVVFGLYLFIASTVFTKSLFALKDLVNPKKSIENTIDLDAKKIDVKKVSAEAKPTIKVNSVKVEEKETEVKSEKNKVEGITVKKENTGTGKTK